MGTIADVKKLAIELMSKEFTIQTYYGERTMSAMDLGYYFEFGNRKKAFGTCYYVQKKIVLSLPLCSENLDKIETRIYNTILHEIAHAFCVEVYGLKHGRGHGSNWKSIASQIGCDAKRCFDSSTVNMPKGKYSLICDHCGYESPKHRKVTRTYACARCCNKHNGGKFSVYYKLRMVTNY